MPIDRKAYKADKKKYKKEVKTAKSEFKETGFSSMGNPFAPKRSDYKEKSPTSGYRNYPNTDKETVKQKREKISFFRFKVIMPNDKHLTQMNCVKYAKYEL